MVSHSRTEYAKYVNQRVLEIVRENDGVFIEDLKDLAGEFQVQVEAFRPYLKLLNASGLIESIAHFNGTRKTVYFMKRQVLALSEPQNRVLNYINEHPFCSNVEIARALKRNKKRIVAITRKLEKKGLIDFKLVRGFRKSFVRISERSSIYAKYVYEKILAIIQKKEGCHFADILKHFQMTKNPLLKHLKLLKELGLVKTIKLRGEHQRYFTRDGFPSERPLCAFCGAPISNVRRIFNVFFPSSVYCNASCKNANAPRFSEADLQKIASKVSELRKFRKIDGNESI